MTTVSEADVEQIALNHLTDLGWQTANGPDIDHDCALVIIEDRLRDDLARLNPALSYDALGGAYHQLTQPEGSILETRNGAVHRKLIWGVKDEYRDSDRIRAAQVQPVRTDKQPRIQKPHPRLCDRNDCAEAPEASCARVPTPFGFYSGFASIRCFWRWIMRRTLYAREEAQTMTMLRNEALPHLTAVQLTQVSDGPMVAGGDADGC